MNRILYLTFLLFIIIKVINKIKPSLYKKNIRNKPNSKHYDEILENMDIVYCWVDGNDTKWQKKHNSKRSCRNNSNDELKYSIRSLEKYLPWHKGRIIIVTPGQTPPWIKSNSRLKIINQESIIPKSFRPVSNSFVIELFLHKIPNLTEHYVYLNDDYFFNNPIEKEYFFVKNGDNIEPMIRFNKNSINLNESQLKTNIKQKKLVWLSATINTSLAIREKYGIEKQRFLEHAPYCFKKSIVKQIYQEWETEFNSMKTHKQRHWNDFIMVLIYSQFVSSKQKSINIKKYPNNIYFCIITDNTIKNNNHYKNINSNNYKMFVLNDAFNKNTIGNDIKKFLQNKFPKPSRFES